MKVTAKTDGSARVEYAAAEHEGLLATVRNRVGADSDVARQLDEAGPDAGAIGYDPEQGPSVVEAIVADNPDQAIDSD